MKHIIRKPVLPLLLAALLLFGVLFLTLFEKGIADDEQQVEELYNNTRITFQILPGENSGNQMALDTFKGKRIAALERIAESYGLMSTQYALMEGGRMADSGMIFGTNNPGFFCRDNKVTLTWFEGCDESLFADYDPYRVPCLVEEGLREYKNYAPGEEIQVSPLPYSGLQEDTPVLELHVAGTYRDPFQKLAMGGILVPEDVFLVDVTLPHLLYNPTMMYDCVYRQFAFRIDPVYNRNYEEILAEVEDILPGGNRFEISSDAKALTLAVRPLERKLAIQRILLPALTALLCAAVAVVTLLLVLSWKREIFLRLMWGETRPAILVRLLLSLLGLLAACSLLALTVTVLTAGAQWISPALRHLGQMVSLCLGAGLIPLAWFSGKNLIKLYQSGEG